MPFFNRRPKHDPRDDEIKQLSAQIATLLDENRGLRNQVEYLVRTIRDTDQEIFNMSQKTTWDGMRPGFNKLLDEVTARKVAESKRIADIMRPQLTETYSQPPQKRLGR